MASPRNNKDERPPPRLYLVAPAAADIGTLKLDLLAALDNAGIAAVLLRLPHDDDRALTNRVKALAPAVQNFDAALILDGHPGIVARSGADGAHLTGIAAFQDAAGSLKPDRIAGCGGLATRHDAMLAAEGGADYVMFGEPDEQNARPSFEAVLERVSWWAEVFQIPCVAHAASAEEVAALAQAGADFVAVGDFIFSDPRGVARAVSDAAERLRLPEVAA
jgi:thiamine-phosphate pyrophosphorylase